MKSLSKQDVLDLLDLYKLSFVGQDRKVIEGAIDYLQLKFTQHTYELKFEANYGSGRAENSGEPDITQV